MLGAGRSNESNAEGGRSPFAPYGRTIDLLLIALLSAVTISYLLYWWPRDFYLADEGTFLYEAKRILDGDLIYRDFFEIITPGALYLMAMLFRVFGVSIETARAGMAVLHAGIGILVYVLCRRLGVRRTFAILAAFAHLTICYPAHPMSSPHWLSTFLTLAVFMTLSRPAGATSRPGLTTGLLVGALIAVQQQKGAFIAVAGALVLLLDSLLAARGERIAALKRAALWYTTGVATIVGPMMVALLATAGFHPLFAALVQFPLVDYTNYNSRTWNQYPWYIPDLAVLPQLKRYLPIAIVAVFLRFAWRLVRGKGWAQARPLLVSGILATLVIVSILYHPDYVHLSIVTPVFLVLIAETFEAAWRGIESVAPPARLLVPVIALLVIVGMVRLGSHNVQVRRRLYPLSHQTAFGRLDMRNDAEIELVDAIRAKVSESSRRELFCYTMCAGLYLTTGTQNPTPYQIALPGYNPPRQLNEVVRILQERQVPWVVAMRYSMKGDDPIWREVRQHYKWVPFGTKRSFAYGLFQRLPSKE